MARQLQTEWASDPAFISFAPTATTTAISATVSIVFVPTTPTATTTAISATVPIAFALAPSVVVVGLAWASEWALLLDPKAWSAMEGMYFFPNPLYQDHWFNVALIGFGFLVVGLLVSS